MSENSTWTALRNPVFRNIWLASLISGTCVAAQDTAATWSMNRVSPSPLFLSPMAHVPSLPFFFFALPAGALADMVDRKRMMFVMTVWLAIAAGGLALTGWFHLINPWILLIAVFLIGTGFAFYSPAWTSIQPEIVSKRVFEKSFTCTDYRRVVRIKNDVDKLYDTDLTDAAWSLIAPILPAARTGGRPRKTNLSAVLNAIFYLLRTGCQWRLLPGEFPYGYTVYRYI